MTGLIVLAFLIFFFYLQKNTAKFEEDLIQSCLETAKTYDESEQGQLEKRKHEAQKAIDLHNLRKEVEELEAKIND